MGIASLDAKKVCLGPVKLYFCISSKTTETLNLNAHITNIKQLSESAN